MLNPMVDTRDVRFVLFELLDAEKLTKYPKYADFDRATFDATIDLIEQLAVDVFYPTAEEGDKVGAKWDPATKEVKIPECFHPALDAFYAAGCLGLYEDQSHGGMGFPFLVSMAALEPFFASNFCLSVFTTLSQGAMELVLAFGTPEQKKLYVDKLMTGEWGGTMCLTEPDAGSDVGALKTKAVKQADGTYKITGQKIFISSGENDYYKNMVHPVLARIEGDPKGTKGISIFIVPKYLVNEDGSLGKFNDVTCTGIEHKMGIHGQPTSQLAFGDNGDCTGFLLGQERQGMKIMFMMMNLARMITGFDGHANASSAYMHAVTYAKNRVQGSDVTQMLNPDAPSVAISRHPDVKRMLLWMKSHIEGQRILIYYLYGQQDFIVADSDETVKKEAQALMDFLIPICKAGCSDKGVEICSTAMQTYGGYGYCKDYPIVRLFTDSKILAIWEGTNGIQAMDLVMRKLLMNKDQYNYKVFRKRVDDTVSKAKGIVDEKYLELFNSAVKEMDSLVEFLKKHMAEGKFLNIFGQATPFLETMYILIIAWCHIWSLTLTLPKMQALVGDVKGAEREKLLNDNSEAAFYSGKVLASRFYLGTELPKFFGKSQSIKFDETATTEVIDANFTGMLNE